jgi:site-specific recombinase XerD
MDPHAVAARSAVPGDAPRPVTVKEACELWLEKKAGEVGKGAYQDHRASARKLEEWASNLGMVHLREVTAVELRNWYHFRPWTWLSPATRARQGGILRLMFRYWHEDGILDHDPFAEAEHEGRRRHRGPAPEGAQNLTAANRDGVTVRQACDLWRQQMQGQLGKTTYKSYSVPAKKLESWAKDLDVVSIREITSRHLAEWYESGSWLDLAWQTRRQRWVVIRSMFRWWRDIGILERNPAARLPPVRPGGRHVHGPFCESQVQAILEEVAGDPLLRAFVLLLLHSGCDLIDAVLFNPARIEDLRVGEEMVSVYRYLRRETGLEVKIPLPRDVVSVLRSIVPRGREAGSLPFRRGIITLAANEERWTVRVQKAMRRAGVEWIELPIWGGGGERKRRRANCRQFRHHFAVQQLQAGQTPEEVARRLGSTDVDLVRKQYAVWIKMQQRQARIERSRDDDQSPEN